MPSKKEVIGTSGGIYGALDASRTLTVSVFYEQGCVMKIQLTVITTKDELTTKRRGLTALAWSGARLAR